MSEHKPESSVSCPSDIALASFVDGDLTTEARARIVSHLATCDDCREVVAMTALASRAADEPRVPWYQRRRVLVALAAGLAASLVVVLVPRDASRPGSAWSDLAEAEGPARTVVARLSSFDAYRPLRSPVRGVTATNAPNFALEAVAARLREQADHDPSLANLHAAGVAALVLGRSDEAVRDLATAARQEQAGADVYADLAAAHAARAAQSASAPAATADWLSAVGAAERACALDPALAAAWFNRALALEGLGRPDARQAWQDYTIRFPREDGWRAEAAAHIAPGPR